MKYNKKRTKMTNKERDEDFSAEIKKLQAKYRALLKKRVQLENAMLGTPDKVVYDGNSYSEVLYGKLQKNMTQAEIWEKRERYRVLSVVAKKSYNKYYAEQVDKLREEIPKILNKITRLKEFKAKNAKHFDQDNPEYPCVEIMGKPYAELDRSEKKKYHEIIARAKEEKRKMELGLPPYDKLKKK